MNFKSFVFSIILVGILFAGCFAYITSINNAYDTNVDLSGFNKTQNNMKYTEANITKAYDIYTNITFTTDLTSIWAMSFDMMRVGWSSIKILLNTPSLFGDIVSELVTATADTIGIPPWAIAGLIAFITLTLIIIGIELFFRWKIGE